MKEFLGIDLSLNRSGFTILTNSGELDEVGVVDVGKERLFGERRLAYIFARFSALINSRNYSAIGIEGYSFGARGSMVFSIGEAGGIVKLLLHNNYRKNSVPYYVFQPTTIKKYATSKGNAKKSHILKSVYKMWEFDTDDEDVADSYAVAKLTWAHYHHQQNKKIDVKSFQIEVLNKLKNKREQEKCDEKEKRKNKRID